MGFMIGRVWGLEVGAYLLRSVPLVLWARVWRPHDRHHRLQFKV